MTTTSHKCDCNNHPCEHCDMICRFDAEFSNRGFAPGSKEQYLAFIQAEIEKAYKEGEANMKQRVQNLLDEWDDYVIFEEHFKKL